MNHPKEIEWNPSTQGVSAYLGGFTETDLTERCFSVRLYQHIFVEEAQPGIVTVYDVNDRGRRAENLLNLVPCEPVWDGPLMNLIDSSLAEQFTCPVCSGLMDEELEEQLGQALCASPSQLLLFKRYEGLSGRIFLAYEKDKFASWNATISLEPDCECSLIKEDGVFGFFGSKLQPGNALVDFKSAKIVSIDSIMEVIDRVETCKGAEEVFNLLKKMSFIKQSICA